MTFSPSLIALDLKPVQGFCPEDSQILWLAHKCFRNTITVSFVSVVLGNG